MKKQCIGVGLVLLVGFVQPVCAGVTWTAGKTVYKENCKECHSRSGDGGRLKISDYNREFWTEYVENPADELHQQKMESLSSGDKAALLEYFFKYANEKTSEKKKKLGC